MPSMKRRFLRGRLRAQFAGGSPRMRRLVRALALTVAASGSLVVLLGIALYGLAQTETFNRWLAKALQAALREQLNAELSIGSIRVRIFEGVELDSVALVAEGDTLLASPHIELRYIPEALIFRTVAIEVLRLESPRMHLRRLADGTWNFEHILRPTSSPSGEPPSLLVYVRSFEIRSGTIFTDDVQDTIPPSQRPARFDPFHAMLTDVRARATVLAQLRQLRYTLALDELSFRDSISGWGIRRASGIVAVDTASLAVTSLSIALPASNITIADATLGISDSTLPYRARLALTPLHPNDAYHLLPPDITLGSSLELDATVEGSLDSMRVVFVHAATGRTDLRGHVSFHNFRSNASLRWNAELSPSVVWWSDVRQLLGWLDLPSIAALEDCHIAALSARGAGDSLWADVRATTSAGTADLRALLRIGNPIGYTVDGTFSQVNLARLDPSLPASALAGTLLLSGEGTELARAHGQLELSLDTSSIAEQRLTHVSVRAQLDRGRLLLDSLEAIFPRNGGEEQPRVYGHGTIALTGTHDVELWLGSDHMPLRRLLNSSLAPEVLSATVALRSSGSTPDSLRLALNADVTELIFQDRAVFPFKFDATLDFDQAGRRIATIRSPQVTASIVGRYRLAALGRTVGSHITLTDTLLRWMLGYATGKPTAPLPAIESADTAEATFSVHVHSLALLAPLFAPSVIEAEGVLAGSISAAGSRSSVALDTLSLRRLIVAEPNGFYLASMPLEASLHAAFAELDRSPQVEAAQLRVAVDSVLRIGNLRIIRPAIDWRWDGSQLAITSDTAWIENTLPIQFSALIIPQQGTGYTARVNTALIGLSPTFTWSLAKPLVATMDTGTLTVDALLRQEQSTATLNLEGNVTAEGPRCRLALRTFDLGTLAAIPALGGLELIGQLDGQLDSLVVYTDGSWERPRVLINATIGELLYGQIELGQQEVTLDYDGAFLRGSTSLLLNGANGEQRTALDVRLQQVPLDFSLLPFRTAIREHERLAVFLQASQLPLTIVEPFLPAISQLRGSAEAFVRIEGSLPGNIEFSGTARYADAEFLVPATNIRYRSSGVLSLHNNVLELDTLVLRNDPADLIGGTALAYGRITFRGFQPDSLEIRIRIPGDRGFLVMSSATAAVNSTMYGRVVISTDDDRRQRELRFYGTIDEPRLGGFLSIEDADVTFPPTTAVTAQTSSFRYQKTDEGYLVTDAVMITPHADTSIGDIPPRQARARSAERLSIAPGFTERLYTSVDAKLRRQIRVKMDFSGVEQLVAFVEQENRTEYLRFIRDGTRRTELRGTLIVDPSSTYKFYSTFTASGKLRFTTGALDNPEVDLQAVYDGERIIGSDNRRERYRVLLYITGTKRQPRVRMTYELNGEIAPGMRGDSSRIMTNALLLLLFGRTQEELTGGANGGIATSALDQSVNAARSAAVSAFLTNALQGGVIKNVNVDFGSSDVTSLSQARIMLTGQLFGANVTVGGSVADLAQNSQIMLDLSIGNALGIEWLRNLVAQFQATANPGQSLSRQQKQWEFRLGWRVP